jgi:hypothetical protein
LNEDAAVSIVSHRSTVRGPALCEKCAEIDVKLARYRRLLADVNDQIAIVLIKLVLADLESDKIALHPSSDPEH